MSDELLAVVGVDKCDRVVCQAAGCGHGVYRRIHVVRHEDGQIGVYGSDCFERLFKNAVSNRPRYGSGDGRELTPAERQLLAGNTERLIEQFESEYQAALQKARIEQEARQRAEMAANAASERRAAEAARRRPPSAAEIASVEQLAKANIRKSLGVDPDLPGWSGLVLVECRKLLGR